MKHAIWLSSICALSVALLTVLHGCGFTGAQPNGLAPIPPPDAPRPVTNLSDLALGSTLAPFGKRDQVIARRVAAENDSEPDGGENLDTLAIVRHVGDPRHPGEERLLNKKAAQFDLLSTRLLNQFFEEVLKLQTGYEISHLKLPTDLKPVIVTATLDRQGVLKELVIEQHSGMATIDKMVIAACKKGLYIHNPPVEALDKDGNYQIRLQLRMENFASVDGEHWEFKTYMGLAIL
jgi:hypothetical protein